MRLATFHTSYLKMPTWVRCKGEWHPGEIVAYSRKWVHLQVYDYPGKRFKRSWEEVGMRNPELGGKDKPRES